MVMVGGGRIQICTLLQLQTILVFFGARSNRMSDIWGSGVGSGPIFSNMLRQFSRSLPFDFENWVHTCTIPHGAGGLICPKWSDMFLALFPCPVEMGLDPFLCLGDPGVQTQMIKRMVLFLIISHLNLYFFWSTQKGTLGSEPIFSKIFRKRQKNSSPDKRVTHTADGSLSSAPLSLISCATVDIEQHGIRGDLFLWINLLSCYKIPWLSVSAIECQTQVVGHRAWVHFSACSSARYEAPSASFVHCLSTRWNEDMRFSAFWSVKFNVLAIC